MWISKKKWEEMCDTIDRNTRNIKLLHWEVNSLLIEHEYSDEIKTVEYLSVKDSEYHKEKMTYTFVTGHKLIDTNLIPNVTLEELAKLVIDGTPIKRTEKIDMTTEFHGRV